MSQLERPPTRLSIKVDGRWLETYGSWGDPVATWRCPLGCWELTWQMTQTETTLDEYLFATRRRVQVEAFIGATPVWAGYLPIIEPEDSENTISYTALGSCREAEGALCLSAQKATTARPRLAAQRAIDRGILSWRRVEALPDTNFVDPDDAGLEASDATAALNYLGALVDAWCEEKNKIWGVDGNRDVWVADRPADGWKSPDDKPPAFLIRPTVAAMGTTSETAAGSLLGRYIYTNDGKLATARVGTIGPEKALDMTKLGRLTTKQATDRLNSLLDRIGNDAIGWKNGITVNRAQVTSTGGVPTHLGAMAAEVGRGPLKVRLLGQTDPRWPGVWNRDVIVGEAVWNVTEDTVDLNPADADTDDFDELLENTGISVVSP